MKKNAKFSVTEETTLLPFLCECLSGKSRNYAKGVLRRGQVLIDGEICTDYARKLRVGQNVEIMRSAPEEGDAMSIPIIYEDGDIIVIDKPAGMLSISTDKERENTAYHIVTDYLKRQSSGGRAFIVHRLDRETSGLMLLAKNERSKLRLQEGWDEAAVHRGYVAVVEGCVDKPEGRITSWLRQTKTLLVYSSKTEGDGKLAITNYRVIKASGQLSLLEVSLETGRKNQIRVHMKELGHPVTGDKKYGAQKSPIGRLGLHAARLAVVHPSTGEQMSFESPMPRSFTALFNA